MVWPLGVQLVSCVMQISSVLSQPFRQPIAMHSVVVKLYCALPFALASKSCIANAMSGVHSRGSGHADMLSSAVDKGHTHRRGDSCR